MKVLNVEIQNFRGFERFQATLHPELTVIVGNNGAGKSALLDAIAIAAGTFFSGLNGVLATGIAKEDVTCKSYDMGSVIDLQYQYPAIISAQGMINGQSVKWDRALNSENGRTTVIDAKPIISVAAANHQGSSVNFPEGAVYRIHPCAVRNCFRKERKSAASFR